MLTSRLWVGRSLIKTPLVTPTKKAATYKHRNKKKNKSQQYKPVQR
jgi:hypothetical protein